MKAMNTIKLAVTALILVFSVACSKNVSTVNSNPNGNNSQNPGGTVSCTNGVAFSGGASSSLQLTDVTLDPATGMYRSAIFEKYAGRIVNLGCANPIINVNLSTFNVADSGQTPQYGGTFKIGRVENTTPIIGTFDSGTSIFDTKFNKWTTTGGAQKLKLFFQDTAGGIIVILKQVVINDITVTYKGDVYFRNFDFGVCANPPPWMAPYCQSQSGYKCWNISAGPYDCRAFISSNNVRPDIVDAPGFGDHQDGYTGPGYLYLGSFTGMDINLATGG